MKTYFGAFAVLFMVVIANYIGQAYDIAFVVPFYDVFLHFWGGFGIALLLLGMLQSHRFAYAHSSHGRKLLIFSVLVVGLIWEGLEVYFNVAGAPFGTKAYFIDTIKDLVDDVLGGLLALWLAK